MGHDYSIILRESHVHIINSLYIDHLYIDKIPHHLYWIIQAGEWSAMRSVKYKSYSTVNSTWFQGPVQSHSALDHNQQSTCDNNASTQLLIHPMQIATRTLLCGHAILRCGC